MSIFSNTSKQIVFISIVVRIRFVLFLFAFFSFFANKIHFLSLISN